MNLMRVMRAVRIRLVLRLPIASMGTKAGAYQGSKQWQRAIDCWQSDISKRGMNSKNLLGLVTNLMAMRRTQEIVDVMATAKFELDPPLLFKLAEAQQRLGQHENSEATYALSIERMGDVSEVQKSLVRAHSQMHLLPERIALAAWVESNYSQIKNVAAKFEPRSTLPPRLFVFWSQGFSTAPKIVQACLRQLRNLVAPDSLAVLTKDNLGRTIVLPKVFNKVEKRYAAHYSDVLRVALLSKYRGTWLDATVWTSDDPFVVSGESNFFTFRYEGARMASWFMTAGENAKTPQLLYAALIVYWRQHKKLNDYFLLHNIFEILYYLDESVRAEWDAAVKQSAVPCNQLGGKLLWQPYDQEALSRVLVVHPVQKLTYKPGSRNAGPGTLFRHLADSI